MKNFPGGRFFRPAQVLALSFFLAVLAGAVLLWLPFSARAGHVPFIDALFTSTSAICVTGLIVVDTPTCFSGTGQAILLALIQIGGLGIMTFSSLILLVAGGKVSFNDRILFERSFLPATINDFRSLLRNIFIFTLVLEGTGVLVLFLRFLKDVSAPRAFRLAGFHAISAFCNAGFSLFSDSLTAYKGDIAVNLTVILLVILGGLGFFVLQEGTRAAGDIVSRRRVRLSLHSKLVLTMTSVLILFPAILIFVMERAGSMSQFSLKEKILSSLFQTVTARTAGFNTVALTSFGAATVYLLMFLMFIGASPGSTGGGVKTSTVGVILAFLRSKIRARESIGLYRRTLPVSVVTMAYTVISLAICLIFLTAIAILWDQPELGFREVLFEVFSAFGTVGLSLGITAKLSTLSKALIIITMYLGRIGPLTLLYAFSRTRSLGRFEYAEEKVMIG